MDDQQGTHRQASERASDVDTFVERLRRLGTKEPELREVREAWANATPEQRAAAMNLSDAQMRASLREQYVDDDTSDTDDGAPVIGLAPLADGVESEGAPTAPSASSEVASSSEQTEHTSEVGEQGPELTNLPEGAQVVPSPESTTQRDVIVVPDDTVPEVIKWVGDDKERAQAALDVELAANEPRSTLIDALRKLVDDAPGT